MRWNIMVALLSALLVATSHADDSPKGELIFPLESLHNHGSCIVECPNGDMLACWFHGSGERRSDDVKILGARWVKDRQRWTKPFRMADTPDFPDTNCCMIIDQTETLWLLWPTIQANTWESALMKYKQSTEYMMPDGPPKWDVMRVMHVKHSGGFPSQVRKKLAEYVGDRTDDPRVHRWMEHINRQAEDKLTRRIGWFTRAHPLLLEDGRMLVGLYSDGFSFSLVGITDDLGKTWKYSEPIVGGGNIQPSFARRKDGTIVAYMRDNGPPPNKVHVSESKDRGETWCKVYDHPVLNNPGSGLELMRMKDGDWVCIYNDQPDGRHSLAVSLSDDEGRKWKWTRHLENRKKGQGSFHYPSIIEGSDGNLHATYSYFIDTPHNGEEAGKSIRYSTFSKAWIRGELASQTGSTAQRVREFPTPTLDIDLDDQGHRQVVVDREAGQYLGHPTTCLLEDGKTILCVYPKGHGRGAIVYKRSTDGGLTWSDRLPTPTSWATSKEVPTLHRVIGPDGTKRIIMWSGLYPARLSVTEDDGANWSQLRPVGDWGGIVVMGFVEALTTGDGHYLAMFHDDGRFFTKEGKKSSSFKLFKTLSEDGGLTWSPPEVVYESSEVYLCEPGCIRSPDGKQMAVLLRENKRRKNSHVIFSSDEGRTWTQPREVPITLTGDRHTGKYGPDGRLFISFRCISPTSKREGRPFEGDWVGWVGTWDDIVEGRDGQYTVRLKDNTKSYDTSYPGVEVLPDGTFVVTTYGHWAEGEAPYILSVRLKLAELDAMAQ